MRKTAFFLFLGFLFCFDSNCQSTDSIVDSLRRELNKSTADTSRSNLLFQIVIAYQFEQPDSALKIGNELLALPPKALKKEQKAKVLMLLGNICLSQGKFDQGIQYGHQAVDIYTALLRSTKRTDSIELLNELAGAYNVIAQNTIPSGNYTDGLQQSIAALKIHEKLGNKPGASMVEFNIGTIYYCQHNYDDAISHYISSMEILKGQLSKLDTAGTYSAIGLCYFDAGNMAEAEKYYRTAQQMAEETKDPFTIAELYVNLGVFYERKGDYASALKYNFDAFRLYEEVHNNFQYAYLFNNIASVYIKQKKYTQAADYIGRAIRAAEEANHLEYLKLGYQNRTWIDTLKGNYRKGLADFQIYILYRDSLLNKENTRKLVQTQMQYNFDKEQDSTRLVQEKKDFLGRQELRRQRDARNVTMVGLAALALFLIIAIRQRNRVKKEKKRSDDLLLNILPAETAEELKATGTTRARDFEMVTVLFTDFRNFTKMTTQLTAQELVNEINYYYSAFDRIISKYQIEKIKTIGDSYMCAGGLPVSSEQSANHTVFAALEIRDFMEKEKQERANLNQTYFEVRIGLHTGPVIAGIVGIKKFAYDIWGDTVNIASRIESAGEAGKVNISGTTYEFIKERFNCSYRGKIEAKNKGLIDMYFVEGAL